MVGMLVGVGEPLLPLVEGPKRGIGSVGGLI